MFPPKKQPTPPAIQAETHDPPSRQDAPFVTTRLMLLYAIFVLIILAFGVRIYDLTILQGPYFRSESENNFRTETPIIPPRGRILDRNGEPLAINRQVFDVEMSPFNLSQDEITSTVARLAALLGRPALAQKAETVYRLYPKWSSIKLAAGLELDEVLPVVEQGFALPGVIVSRSYQRTYPQGAVAGLVTGYVSAINPGELNSFMERGYLRTEKIGKKGAERAFETLLHGQLGREVVVRDARGKPRSSPFVAEGAQPGHTLILTLDLQLQRLADALLEGHDGVILAMDPRDGSIRAMAQRPNYDPNQPLLGSSFIKIFQGGGARPGFAPGSTFKVVTAAAGLHAGYSPDESIYCDGAFFLGTTRFPCNLRWGHEQETMYDALQHSCNVFFYNWAHRVKKEAMVAMAAGFGFGAPTGFELVPPGLESGGYLADLARDRIYPGHVLQMGIGQGEMISVTPLQLIRAYAALCNGGTLMRPRIVQQVLTSIGEPVDAAPLGQAQPQEPLPLTEPERKAILEGLWRVVSGKGGTGSRAGFKPEWRVAGKTGTAETGNRNIPPNAWFLGFAPFENPEIVILVLIEHAGHGGEISAPVARQLFATYFGQPEPQIVPPPQPGEKPAGDEESTD